MNWFDVRSILGFLKSGAEVSVSDANPLPTIDSSDVEYKKIATSVTNAGTTLLATPASGKSIVLRRVYALNDPTANTSTKITIELGDEVQYVTWGIAQKQKLTGPVNGPLFITLSNPGDVAVTIFYEEV